MTQLRKVLRIILIVLNTFLALTAAGGGIGLITGLNAPPVEQLGGSIFKDFTVPGLSLLMIVGGGATLATVLLVQRNRFAILCSLAAGIAIMFFEFVEVLVIGSPAGVARALQIIYFGLGTSVAVLSMGIQFVDILLSDRE